MAMPAPTFDTLAYADKLKQAGFSEEQAQGQARALAEIVYGEVATRPDLNALESGLRKDLNALESGLRKDLNALEERLNSKIETLGTRLDGKIDALAVRLDGKIDTLAARLDATLSTVATKTELETVRTEVQGIGRRIIMWNTGTIIAVAGLAFAIARWL